MYSRQAFVVVFAVVFRFSFGRGTPFYCFRSAPVPSVPSALIAFPGYVAFCVRNGSVPC